MSLTSQALPQLYRFCFLLTGDSAKAEGAFDSTVREAAKRSARDDLPSSPLWLFRDARRRCLEADQPELEAEPGMLAEIEVSPFGPALIEKLEPDQLVAWISAAPEPQRTALALFYLDEFDLSEMLDLLEIKVEELAELLSSGRRQFQAWLEATIADPEE